MKKILLAGLLTGFLAFGVVGITNSALYKSDMGRTVSRPTVFSAFSGDDSMAYASFGPSIRCAAYIDYLSIGCHHGGSYSNGDMMTFSSEVVNLDMFMFDLDTIWEDFDGVLSVSIGTSGNEKLQFGFDDQLLSNPDKKEPDFKGVPIPDAVWLLGAGLVIFLGIGSRRKKGSGSNPLIRLLSGDEQESQGVGKCFYVEIGGKKKSKRYFENEVCPDD